MDSAKFSPSTVHPDLFPFDTNKTNNSSDPFIVEDLFDFSNHDDAVITDATFDSVPVNSTDSSTVTAVESCNSSSFSDPNPATRNLSNANFSGDLCVPYDDIAELEWLSNFVEESFSSEDLQQLQLISGMKGPNDDASEARGFHSEPTRNSPIFNSEVSVPARARSKRSRGPPCNWASRLLVLSPATSSTEPEVVAPSPTSSLPGPVSAKKPAKASPRKKDSGDGSGGDGRRCLHCATDKTPQWRTGPMGPKTLCNACGVRYKSGRLVPEYRPAASPTFVLTKHSNSHRKVLELRRQKEMVRAQQHQHQHQQQQFLPHHHHQNMMFDVSNGDEYLIHQHVGPDFRQLI
ncbi:GATA transcription factor 12 isoform X2 [Cajanus cajan]|uniref:GATA transcription factor n=1 Tax=Cajanus cajan TaxID=3821 RepID=A0A151QPZ2_CAJCA|nr:GATA transcription factor 12 isoform X2 [Cajanus cajan]KYP32369.1 GATA transcription factor 13 [Cajanus cajan]